MSEIEREFLTGGIFSLRPLVAVSHLKHIRLPRRLENKSILCVMCASQLSLRCLCYSLCSVCVCYMFDMKLDRFIVTCNSGQSRYQYSVE